MQMTKASGALCLDALADRLHHLQVDAEQVVAAHARLAGDAGGDDDDVGAGDVGIVVRAGDLGVEALDRAALATGRAPCPAARPRPRRTGRCRPVPSARRGGRACRRYCRRRSARSSCEPWRAALPSWQARQLVHRPAEARAKAPCRSQDWRRPYADSLKETTAKRAKNRLFPIIVRNSFKSGSDLFGYAIGGTSAQARAFPSFLFFTAHETLKLSALVQRLSPGLGGAASPPPDGLPFMPPVLSRTCREPGKPTCRVNPPLSPPG